MASNAIMLVQPPLQALCRLTSLPDFSVTKPLTSSPFAVMRIVKIQLQAEKSSRVSGYLPGINGR